MRAGRPEERAQESEAKSGANPMMHQHMRGMEQHWQMMHQQTCRMAPETCPMAQPAKPEPPATKR